MLIVCPHCAKSYDVERGTLGGQGRSVRCMRCRTVFFAETSQAAVPPVEREAAAPPEAFTQAPADNADTFDAAAGSDDATMDAWAAAEEAERAERAAREAAGPDAAFGETEALTDSPSIVPPQREEPRFKVGEGPFPMTGGDIDVFAARRARNRAKKQFNIRLPKFRWPLEAMPTAILALGTIVVVLVGWRAQMVRLAPQTASFYETIGLGVNLRGLEFDNLKTSRETHEGIPVLAVAGEIVSVTGKPVEVPRLRFSVRNIRGNEIYAWTAMPPQAIATPGETVTFRSRLASPPEEAHDVVVRFYTRRDATAALR